MAESSGEATGEVMLLQGARAFNKEVAPAFLDHVCMTAGFAPPPGSPVGEGQGAGFAWCELHCGSGTNPTLLAASNPLGDFHGIDAREALLADGRLLANAGGVRNVSLHRAGLEEALELSLPAFDYVVVSGIYSWVPFRERGLVLAFLRKFLKPGGAVYITYNARPGWNRLEPFRRLFREATRDMDAPPHQRLALASDIYAAMERARAPAILASGISAAMLDELDAVSPEVIEADYANDFAEPLYVSEVAADLAAVDCALAASAEMAVSLPTLSPHEPFKSLFARMPALVGQELAKDMFLDTRFRRDVFVRGGRRLSADNREMLMAGLVFVLERPAAEMRYEVRMPFGEMRFDTPDARELVAALAEAPRSMGELFARAQNDLDRVQSLAAAIHALLVTAQIRPAYRSSREAAQGATRLQSAIQTQAGTAEAVAFLPSEFGTAFHVPVADQIFAGLPDEATTDARTAAAVEKLGGDALPPPAKEALAKRAKGFERTRAHYRLQGISSPG